MLDAPFYIIFITQFTWAIIMFIIMSTYNISLLKTLMWKFEIIYMMLNSTIMMIGIAILYIHNNPDDKLMYILVSPTVIVGLSAVILIDAAPPIMVSPLRKAIIFTFYTFLMGSNTLYYTIVGPEDLEDVEISFGRRKYMVGDIVTSSCWNFTFLMVRITYIAIYYPHTLVNYRGRIMLAN